MTTKIIGIKKFRQNMTSLWKEARENNIRFIVLHHSEPVFEVTPIDEDELIVEKYGDEVEGAWQSYKDGAKVYTLEEARKELGL